jgi:hypothetical protein
MCCFLASLSLFGPRLGFLIFWLFPYGQLKISVALNGWFLPLMGLIFLPWTTLAYVMLFPVISFDWIWLGFAFLADLAGYGAGAARRRDVSWYTGP